MDDTNVHIKIKSFGGCSVTACSPDAPEDVYAISETEGRSKKHWTLIEYLIFSGRTNVSAGELIDLIWPNQAGPEDPVSALRLIVHRARNELNRLKLCKGSQLIVLNGKSYSWNKIPCMSVDAEEFVLLHEKSKSGSVPEQLNCLLAAIDLYDGRFLSHSAHEHWIMSLDAYYHSLYVAICVRAVDLLQTFGRYQDVITLCRRAVSIDPFFEQMHTALIKAMGTLGLFTEANEYFEHVSAMFMREFATEPSPKMLEVHREIVTRSHAQRTDVGKIRESLYEDVSQGAFRVEYEVFRQVCRLKMRETGRSGQVMQLVLITLLADAGMDGNSLKMHLDDVICSSLRQNDLFTCIKNQQYLLLLQSASYENTLLILERIRTRFLHGGENIIVSAELKYSLLPFAPQSLTSFNEAASQ